MSNESQEARLRAQALQKEQEAAGVLLGLCASSGLTKDSDSPQSVHSADVAGANLRVPSAQRGRRTRGDSHDNSDSAFAQSMMPPMYSHPGGRQWHSSNISSFMSPNHPSHAAHGMHGFGSPVFHPPSASSGHTPGVAGTSAAMRMNMLRNNGLSSPGYNPYPPPSLGMPGFAGLPTGQAGAPSAAHSTAAQQLLALSPHAYVRQMSLSAAAAEAGVSPADLVAAAQAIRARAAGSPAGPSPPRDTTAKALDFDGPAPPKRKRSASKRQSNASSSSSSPTPAASGSKSAAGSAGTEGAAGGAGTKSANCVTQRFASNVNRRSDFRVPAEAVLRFQGSKALQNTGRGACFSATADSRVMDEGVRAGLLQARPHPLILQSDGASGGDGTLAAASADTPAPKPSGAVPGSAASATSALSMASEASADDGNVVSLRNGCMGILERDVAQASGSALNADAALLVSRLLVASQLPEDVFGIDRLAELRDAGVEPSTSRCQADERGMEMYALGKQLWLAWIQLHCVKPFPTPYLSAMLRHITGFTRRNEVDLYRNYRRRHLGSVVDAVREASGVPGSPRPPTSRQGRKRPREES